MAKLYFYYSTMNAGKSTRALQSNFNYKERGMDTLLYTVSFDDRFGKDSSITSRIGLSESSNTFDCNLNIYDDILSKKGPKTACILIDEAQFLIKKQVLDLCKLVDYHDISVLTYGLRSDFMGEPFEGSMYLLLLADEMVEIKGICHCGRKTIMNARLDKNKKIVRSGTQIEIGGNEMYTSLCRKHYFDGKIE